MRVGIDVNDPITGYELWRLEVPTGRVIGDNNCEYDSLGVVAVCLKTRDGHQGWGFDATCWKGKFRVPAWYIQPMASQAEMSAVFEQEWWPRLPRTDPQTRFHYLDAAVRLALWDGKAKEAGLPLYRLLGGQARQNRVRAYASLLDFPLGEEVAVALARRFVACGFRAIKVKIGADDVGRDIQRLHAIKNAVGPGVELTADANTIWTCDKAIANLREIEKSGIRLGYIEDPLPHTDRDGFARLGRELPLDVVGHDYVAHVDELGALLETGGLKRIRNGTDLDFSLACAKLAAGFGAPMIFGNSLFEFNVHAACALPNVDRLEFSDLRWNDLIREPVRFEQGFAIAPDRPGHGLDPKPEALREWSRPEE